MATSSPTDCVDCGCASEPTEAAPLHNPPERSQLSYRVGTHDVFLRRMLERLPWQTLPDGPHGGTRPLAGLATHSERDPTVALLDAFSMVADVLTFYQERIANEGFLRTATEPRSVRELARALGHELSPGLAAATWLAFTVEEAAGAPEQVLVEPGVRVLSIPGQNERPQTFETTERLVARRRLNQLLPITSVPEEVQLGSQTLWLDGVQTNLSSGDTLLLLGSARETDEDSDAWEMRTVATVTPDAVAQRTLVTFTPSDASPGGGSSQSPGSGTKVFAMRHRAAVFGHNAPDWFTMPQEVQQRYRTAYAPPNAPANLTEWPAFGVALTGDGFLNLDALYPRILPRTWMLLVLGATVQLCWVQSVKASSYTNFALTARCTAVELSPHVGSEDAATIDDALKGARRSIIALGQGEPLAPGRRPLVNATWGTHLLAPFPDVRASGGEGALDEADKVSLDRVVTELTAGRVLAISGKRLRARVMLEDGLSLTAASGVRAAYAKDEVLFVLTRPTTGDSGGEGETRVWHLLDAGGFEGQVELQPGALRLEPAEPGDPTVSELVRLKGVNQTLTRTQLVFTEPLKYWYDRATTVLQGNVAVATHGETAREVLGSGDGSQPNQRFTLKRSPLTWVSAATPTGRRNTLEVRVDGVAWREVESFHDHGPRDRVYLTQRDDQGRTTVIFGDGIHGARLPTGEENVVATYRSGLGAEGAVSAGKLSLFQTRPFGLRAVTNPLPASGAEAPDDGALARHDVPVSVLTLDRIVSVMDYETFAQSFAGIGKARATFLRRGETQRLHLTLALADGTPTPDDAVILDALRKALDDLRDTTTPVELAGFEPTWFRVAATLRTSADYRFEDVVAAARAALTDAFSFERRAFGQGVSAAEVVALLQGVPGVDFVDLDGLARGDPGDPQAPEGVEAWLSAEEARWSEEDTVNARARFLQPEALVIRPAQLLLLDPSPLGLVLTNRDEVAS
ncbi:putative baseplate assembly protein [Pyxidicoccus xibeiensis]|uniref:putative baseplate assembly protein n=1 Tax=Pyxidicoccus xibeiensis TaxID=2906759 RepID=UPI0020A798F2|nr:putative baseplate assembly protein [Pyxidicoccus xibeiensis]MCP3137402.1 putative baseplate assembly protein [Pyxidicoccus xibeiensis]